MIIDMYTNDMSRTRVQAKDAGQKYYFTGKPCSKGHVVERHLTGTCVECQRLANRAWNGRNPGEGNRRSLEWQKRNPERCREKNLRSWRKRAKIPEATRPVPLNCENCTKLLVPGRFHLDHCHKTGKFRGWLCNQCNMGIGALGDTIEGLKQAIAYLERAES